MSAPRILLIGGTFEARKLAPLLPGMVITSLAGKTSSPIARPGETRIGGFGGIEGFCDYILSKKIDAIVDAAHPFAAQMHRHVTRAAGETNVPAIALIRPIWKKNAHDQWLEVQTVYDALRCSVGIGRRILLSHGREVPASIEDLDCAFVLRTLEPLASLPSNVTWIKALLPLELKSELALIDDRGIEAMIAKQSGGTQTYAKIEAARIRKIPVVMIERPQLELAGSTGSVDGVLAWLKARGLSR